MNPDHRPRACMIAMTLLVTVAATASEADRVHVHPDSDARAIEIAQATVAAMGGWQGWDATRFLSWKFFGGRQHYWDRHTGDVRIEGEIERPRGTKRDHLWLMNVDTGQGRVWIEGQEVTDATELAELLTLGRQIWVNDSYWLVMPFKLLDPGVKLSYSGERQLEDGRAADVLELTFDEGVGYTPENRYEVYVARESGLIEQWSFYRRATDEQPGFTMPWAGWQRFGEVMLATSRGRGADWQIAVHDRLPPAVFRDPAAVPTGP